MLILRGIAGTFNGESYPNGALDEESAKDYARLRGYEPRVLDVSGEASVGSKQHKAALAEFLADPDIEALYGFSGGAYNLAHVLDDLTPAERERLALVVALGAPGNPASRYSGPWETVYRKDPPSGHMDGPRALLAEAQKEQVSKITALPLRYLIAVEDQLPGYRDVITEVGYDAPRPKPPGPAVRYGNLYDQTGTGAYGPYLAGTETADQYDERVVDPKGAGWVKLLSDQCVAARANGFDTIEWDNPDGYGQNDVLNAVQYAASHGLKVLAKNPLICDWDPVPYVKHPAVTGVIVEKDDDATPAVYDDLRRAAGKPNLPIYFVAFKNKREDGTAWANTTAKAAVNYLNMWVTMSPDGEYTSSIDVAPPLPSVPPVPLVPAIDHFPECVRLLLVHEGGNDDDPRDPGGRTSRGITQREYDTWRHAHAGLPADVWQAPQATVLDIYRAKYWNAMRCDDLPAGIDYCVFDYGVNSGLGRAIPLLQKTLGVAVDGSMGPLTIAAARGTDPVAFINRYQDARLTFLHGLSTWSVFGRGWGTRVADVRRDALKMAGGAAAPEAPSAPAYDTLWVQQTLNKLGASPPLKEDGDMGPATRAAIKEFQAAHGLKPDGVAGPLTRAEMVQQLNVGAGPKPILPPPPGSPLLPRVVAGMEARGYPIDKGPGEVNIAYAEGHDRDGKRNSNAPGLFNDVRMVFDYADGAPRLLGSWTGSTQPGAYYTMKPLNPQGCANIYPGSYRAWKVGLHRGQYEALVQRGTIKLTRDKNKDFRREGDAVEVGDYEGVNQHHAANAGEVGPHSAGCLVGKMVDGHEEFMRIVKTDPRWKADRNFMFTTAILAQSEVPL
jgi:lysozyme family protein